MGIINVDLSLSIEIVEDEDINLLIDQAILDHGNKAPNGLPRRVLISAAIRDAIERGLDGEP